MVPARERDGVMKLSEHDKTCLLSAINGPGHDVCDAITVTFHERRPIVDGWDVAELQDEVNAACAGTDVWGYIVPLRNEHECQTIAILISRRLR